MTRLRQEASPGKPGNFLLGSGWSPRFGPRLDAAAKDAICAAYAAGEPIKVIAERHGVDLSYPSLLARHEGAA